MTTLLMLDCASQTCSAALYYQNQLTQKITDEPRAHSRELLHLINGLLRDADIALDDLSALAFTHGPGGFTGLRITSSVIQGLAVGLTIPVLGVSTLQTLAQRARREWGAEDVVAVMDARMGEVYLGHYRADPDGVMQPIRLDALLGLIAAQDYLESLPATVCVGSGIALLPAASLTQWCQYPNAEPLAYDICPKALLDYDKGLAVPVDDMSLIYLRNDVAHKSTS